VVIRSSVEDLLAFSGAQSKAVIRTVDRNSVVDLLVSVPIVGRLVMPYSRHIRLIREHAAVCQRNP
jgi:hypothetical protein